MGADRDEGDNAGLGPVWAKMLADKQFRLRIEEFAEHDRNHSR